MHRRHLRLGLCALFVAAFAVGAPVAHAAEPDEDTVEVDGDDEAPTPDESVDEPETERPTRSTKSEGSEPAEQDQDEGKPNKGAKTKRNKAPKAKRGKAEKPIDPLLPPERTSGKQARSLELKKPWIKRWAPERDMLDVGLYMGALFLPTKHGLFDAGDGPRPSLKRSAFDIGGRLAYMPLSFLGLGLEVGGMPSRSPSEGTKATLSAFRVHLIGQLPYRVTPTVVIGGGFIAIKSSAGILNELDSAFHWGVGLKVHANQWIAVRMDGRHIVTPGGAEGGGASYGELLFGVDVTLRMRRLVKPRKIDRDDDGLYDRDDACPYEAGDGDDGCPLNRDTDKDGVIDRKDLCPKEYGDDTKGCPIPDKDGDGILDSKDSCEDQAETYNAFDDADGCPDETPDKVKKLTGVIAGITFDSGKTTIRKSSKPVLNSVVSTLEEFATVRVEIIGHTDDQGARDGNVALSAKRAEAVKAYLVGAGIDAARLTTRGEGPDKPIGDNKTKAGRAENRRIEFKVQ